MEINVEEYARTSWYSVLACEGRKETTYTVVENYDTNSDHSNYEFVNEVEIDSEIKARILKAINEFETQA